MLFKCPKHDISASIDIGRKLKSTIDSGEKAKSLISVLYDFTPGEEGGTIEFIFSPEEANQYNIPYPGIVITFDMDSDEEPPDPYEEAKKNMTIMCYKCFEEVYGDELAELNQNRAKFKKIKL